MLFNFVMARHYENPLEARLFKILRFRKYKVLVGFPIYYYYSSYLPKGFTDLEKIKK